MILPADRSARRSRAARRLLSLWIVAWLGAAVPAAASDPQAPPRVRFLLSGDVLGEAEPCACADRPLGGLAQRAFLVSEVRRADGPTVVLDAGNLLFRSLMALSEDAESRRKASAMALVDAYSLMGVDAVNVGPHDLSAGLDYLQRLQGRAGFPWLSSNLVDPDSGEPVFTERLTVERDGTTVAVLGVLPGQMQGAGYRTTDPVSAARAQAAEARQGGADLVVLLSSLGLDEERQLARKVQDVDLILGCGDRAATDPPVWVGDTLLVHPGSRGKDMAQVEWRGGKGKGRFEPDVVLVERGGPVDEEVHALVEELRVRIEDPHWQEAAPPKGE